MIKYIHTKTNYTNQVITEIIIISNHTSQQSSTKQWVLTHVHLAATCIWSVTIVRVHTHLFNKYYMAICDPKYYRDENIHNVQYIHTNCSTLLSSVYTLNIADCLNLLCSMHQSGNSGMYKDFITSSTSLHAAWRPFCAYQLALKNARNAVFIQNCIWNSN